MDKKPPKPFNRAEYLNRAKNRNHGISDHHEPTATPQADPMADATTAPTDAGKKATHHQPKAKAAAKPPKAVKAARFKKSASDTKTSSAITAARNYITRLKTASRWVDVISNALVPQAETGDYTTPDTLARPMLVRGMWLTVFVLGGILLFASLFPLATGAIAPGKLAVDSNRKEIQHLEGGIVKEILVKEGDVVQEGAVLVKLDTTTAEARTGLVFGQIIAARATEARLLAERDGLAEVTFPPALQKEAASNPEVAAALDAQKRLFSSRKKAIEGQIQVLNQKIAQTSEEINGLNQQIRASSSQIALLDDEISVVRGLLETGNAVRPRLLALERQQAALSGERGQARALISRAHQTINEAKIEIINLKNQFLNEVVAELKQTQVEISNLEEQERTSADFSRRTDITAPITGQVTGLRIFTKGGVIKPGDTVMTLVPIGDKLVVEAKISPLDIDVVHQGLDAHVRFLSLSTRQVHPVSGTVVTVSADRFDDPATGEAYYTARIEIPKDELAHIQATPLTPGMPVEALIVTGSRTMLSYLFRPIHDSFNRAFRQE